MIKGIIFDYGGTLDTAGEHWSEVIWRGYRHVGVPVDKALYRKAYVHGERTLAKFPLVRPEDTFLDVLKLKLKVQTSFLVDAGFWTVPAEAELWEGAGVSESHRDDVSQRIAQWCYCQVQRQMDVSRKVLEQLSERYPLVLVSNFYGNIGTVLKEMGLDGLFKDVVESAVVGVRKPNPRIFELGVESLDLKAEECVVVGDSYDKDIVPACQAGCMAVWLKGSGWTQGDNEDESICHAVITEIKDLLFTINN